MIRRVSTTLVGTLALLACLALAAPTAAQSQDVAFIGGSTLSLGTPCGYGASDANTMYSTGGGCLPVSGPAGELGDFTFTPMLPTAVSAASLSLYDTAVLNVASWAMACNTNNLSAAQQADLIAWVEDGHKLIIYDSECWTTVDYSWLPYPFSTANPGAMGATGTLTIVEENALSSADSTEAEYYIDYVHLGSSTDAVGDMNVMTTFSPYWCVDMSGTNVLGVTGPVHTYAKTGLDKGLIIYNGLDMDYLWYNDTYLRKIWYLELAHPFNPSNLPCGVTVVGITLGPEFATNYVGEGHTVNANLTDLLGEPQEGIEVFFEVIAGPNAGASGVCSVYPDCTTDEDGNVSFTYAGSGGTGTDEIVACFFNDLGEEICSASVFKTWEGLPVPVDIKPTSCRNPFNMRATGVLPVAILGTATFDVTLIDPVTVMLAGASPLRWSLADVATPFEPYLGKVDPYDCTTLGPDGYLDMTFKFNHQQVAAALGPVAPGDVIVVPLDGYLFDGTYIFGEDVIVILE